MQQTTYHTLTNHINLDPLQCGFICENVNNNLSCSCHRPQDGSRMLCSTTRLHGSPHSSCTPFGLGGASSCATKYVLYSILFKVLNSYVLTVFGLIAHEGLLDSCLPVLLEDIWCIISNSLSCPNVASAEPEPKETLHFLLCCKGCQSSTPLNIMAGFLMTSRAVRITSAGSALHCKATNSDEAHNGQHPHLQKSEFCLTHVTVCPVCMQLLV